MAARTTGRTPKRIFYKIGEVCELTKTEPYVLRYWESEFPFLAPEKNRSGQRIYSDDDIQMVLAIKRLLYEEGYTTAGARRRLEKELASGGGTPSATEAEAPSHVHEAAPAAQDDRGGDLRGALRQVRDGLSEIRDLLGGPRAASSGTRGKRRD